MAWGSIAIAIAIGIAIEIVALVGNGRRGVGNGDGDGNGNDLIRDTNLVFAVFFAAVHREIGSSEEEIFLQIGRAQPRKMVRIDRDPDRACQRLAPVHRSLGP